MSYIASKDLAAHVLEGDVRAIARLITRAESGVEEARAALDAMFAKAGRAHIVGITGVPGSGKSTLVAKLAGAARASGRKVGIVAIDPSSPFSGGAILGDRIRMGELAGDSGVFVRSMATRGALGGLAHGTLEAVDILDAAGYELVVIETVGVGQDEVEVARAAHTTVVVSAPGLGDDIQAIKAGILEIADVHVVSKCDRPDANKTIADLKAMLALGLAVGATSHGWRPPVVATSGLSGDGVAEVLAQIDRHRSALCGNGEMDKRRAQIAERRLLRAAEEILREHFERRRDGHLRELIDETHRRVISPHAAARRLLNELSIGGTS
ncbi:MAG TPA: methylmalonyl Co-A mutase-associated GTPase MeaB [Casimicrobiaceae bacterium]|jgi:LAO/AO transport system kinase